MVIPWYLIPGRPYPLQVYQFACSYYSTNPEVGQRGAAEATRSKFNLKTFSHSTVCRSFKSFELAQKSALEKRFGEEAMLTAADGLPLVGGAVKCADDEKVYPGTDSNPPSGRRFPSAVSTACRRTAMGGFLPKFQKKAKIADIEAAACRSAKDWHEKYRRLLL